MNSITTIDGEEARKTGFLEKLEVEKLHRMKLKAQVESFPARIGRKFKIGNEIYLKSELQHSSDT